VVDKWRKEDEMRVRLMHEVYQSRKDNIDNKSNILYGICDRVY